MKHFFQMLLIVSLLLLFSCNQSVSSGAGGQDESVQEVQMESVIPKNVNSNAKPVSEDVFKSTVANQIETEISRYISSLTNAQFSVTSGNRAVTMADLEKSFSDFINTIDMNQSDDGTSGYISGAWNPTVGKIDLGAYAKGVDAEINELNLDVDMAYSISGENLLADASAHANFNGTLDLDVSEIEPQKCIKMAKFNAVYRLALDDAFAELDVSGMSSDYNAVIGAIKKLEGNYSLYEGLEGAFYFEVPVADGNIYNGIIAVKVAGDISFGITKENLKELVQVANSLNSSSRYLSSSDLAKLEHFIKIGADVSVYDLKGNKMFTYFSATTLSEIYAKTQKFR